MAAIADRSIEIPWGGEQLTFPLPASWQLVGRLEPERLPPSPDPAAEVRRALMDPIGAARLRDFVPAAARCAIVVDDGSRPTPVGALLAPVLEQLATAGRGTDRLTLVTALGLHRPMTADEVAARIAPTPLEQLRWENHDCDAADALVLLGTTSRGTPVWVNRTVAQADVIVSIGCIEPHIIAGFGGGYKNLVPGVAGRATIGHNHRLNCAPSTWSMVGRATENPMRSDLEEAARLIPGRVFIVNAVLDSAQRIVRVVAGDPVAAHRAGTETSARMNGVRVSRRADVVIASSHPMDLDLRQGVKALANTLHAVRPGGVHITCARALEGVGVMGLAERRLPVGPRTLHALAPLLVRLVPRLHLKGMGEEDLFFLYFALQAMRHAELLLYAPTVPPAARAGLPFVRFVDSPAEAIALARRRFPDAARVLVFPHGGTTYPTLGPEAVETGAEAAA